MVQMAKFFGREFPDSKSINFFLRDYATLMMGGFTEHDHLSRAYHNFLFFFQNLENVAQWQSKMELCRTKREIEKLLRRCR